MCPGIIASSHDILLLMFHISYSIFLFPFFVAFVILHILSILVDHLVLVVLLIVLVFFLDVLALNRPHITSSNRLHIEC